MPYRKYTADDMDEQQVNMSDMETFGFRRRGILMVISAPSGGGKSAVLRRLLESESALSYSVSVTSRLPRVDEIEGKDYFFVDRPAFDGMVARDEFYESAEVHGNMYGTREKIVQEALAAGQDLVMDIDVQGGLSVKYRSPDSVLIFLMPPDRKVLEQRLRGRATDSEDDILLRLKNANHELQYWPHYDYVVTNTELESTVDAVRSILHAERHRAGRLKLLK